LGPNCSTLDEPPIFAFFNGWIGTSDSDEVLKKRAEASFRREERAKDGKKGAADYAAVSRAVAAKAARLRALRLAKEAAEKNDEVPNELAMCRICICSESALGEVSPS